MKSAIVLGSVGLLAAAVSSYALYFDYNRRNNAEYRKELKRGKLRAEKEKAKAKRDEEEKMVALLTKAMSLVKNQKYPQPPAQREAFFTEQIQTGETLARNGGPIEEIAACFYRAAKVMQNPVDLLVLLQNSLPEDVVGLVYAMISTDVKLNRMSDIE